MLDTGGPLLLPLGGGDEIGASSYYLATRGCKLLIDTGIRLRARPLYPRFDALWEFGIDGLWELDAVFVTHAHLDHVGSLPRVYQEAPSVPIYATAETIELASILLMDTIAIGVKEGRYNRDSGLFLYQKELVLSAVGSIRPINPAQSIEFDNFRVTCWPAGHILGAVSVLIETGDVAILFSGDISDFDQLTVRRSALPADLRVDILVLETTYGYGQPVRDTAGSVAEQREALARMVADVVGTGGIALVPAFAVGRAQEVALALRQAFQYTGEFPIVIDGLAKEVTRLYEKMLGIAIYDDIVRPAPPGYSQSEDLEPSCIIASSGMLLEGSCSSYYAKRLLPDDRNCICFSGYLDEDSPGYALTHLKRRDILTDSAEVLRKARITSYYLSAHSDRLGLIELIKTLRPQKVVLVHGCPRQGGPVNIIRDLYAMFNDSVEIYQATNGVPIYL